MTQQNPDNVTVITDVEKKQNPIKRFITNHPRKAKAVAITAAIAAAAAVGVVVGSKKGDFDSTEDDATFDELEGTGYTSEA